MPFDLPPLPGTHTRALGMVGQQDITFMELASVVETDPGLTAAVLRAANSALSSPINRIETAEQALVRVGIERTRRIVAGAILPGNLANLSQAGLDTDDVWRHIVACSLIADVTAWGEVRRSAAFTAGLLHDVGRLALAHQHPREYARAVALAHQGTDIIEAERAVFGTDHVEAGREVAASWDLPVDIADAIADHHEGSNGAMAWVTWNARRVAWSLGIGDGVARPDGITLDPKSEDAEIVDALGGPDHFLQQVEWYCGAMTGAAAAAA